MPRASSTSKPNPEPAEGQVPAGDYTPVTEETTSNTDAQNENQENKSVQEVAKEVVAGRWGRGQRSKERLKEAGYDVEAVNKEVKNIFNQR